MKEVTAHRCMYYTWPFPLPLPLSFHPMYKRPYVAYSILHYITCFLHCLYMYMYMYIHTCIHVHVVQVLTSFLPVMGYRDSKGFDFDCMSIHYRIMHMPYIHTCIHHPVVLYHAHAIASSPGSPPRARRVMVQRSRNNYVCARGRAWGWGYTCHTLPTGTLTQHYWVYTHM